MKKVRLLANSYYQGDDRRTKGQILEVSDEEAERLESIGAATDAGKTAVKPPAPGDELGSLTVSELDDRLDAADLPKTGNKADKIARLREAAEE